MSIHRIRLIGPWEYAWSSAAGSAVTTGIVTMPCDWQSLFGPQAGSATFSRRFHKPTNLELHEKVMAVLTGVRGQGSVSLNGQHLCTFDSEGGQVEVEVTQYLHPFNTLAVLINFDPSRGSKGGLPEPVVLEIRGA